VFNHCTCILGEQQQQQARDLYWAAVSSPRLQGPSNASKVQGMFEQAAQLNPYMAEPHLMLAQLHVQATRWGEGEAAARQALRLFLEWGTPYDKVRQVGARGRGGLQRSRERAVGRAHAMRCKAFKLSVWGFLCYSHLKHFHIASGCWTALKVRRLGAFGSCWQPQCILAPAAAAVAACAVVQRMEWGAWVAWARVILEAALSRSWPNKEPLEVLSKGLVGGL
jgi:hypothetical protein